MTLSITVGIFFLERDDLNEVRLAKEFIDILLKFNERCFVASSWRYAGL